MPRKSSSSVQIFYPKFDKQEIVKRLSSCLQMLQDKLPLILVILFGSYAKGNYTVASDIDLLIVYDGEEKDDAYAIVKKTLSIPHLEPHIYTRAQFQQMKGTIEAMSKDGIVLFCK